MTQKRAQIAGVWEALGATRRMPSEEALFRKAKKAIYPDDGNLPGLDRIIR